MQVLDKFLDDEELVASKREAFMNQTKKMSFDKCPVCDVSCSKVGIGSKSGLGVDKEVKKMRQNLQKPAAD